MNLDLTTERGALNYAERARSSMSDEWRKHGRFERNGHAYGAELFATHAVDTSGTPGQWKPGEKLPRCAAAPCNLPKWLHLPTFAGHTITRDLMAETVTRYAKACKAIGVLFLSEMWFIHVEGDGMTPEKAAEARKGMTESLEHEPGRKEALFMSLEHSALPTRRQWRAEILRNPNRLEPWVDFGMRESQGRFVDLVEWQS